MALNYEGECLCACQRNFEPQCGKDGRTYPNKCEMNCKYVNIRVTVIEKGLFHNVYNKDLDQTRIRLPFGANYFLLDVASFSDKALCAENQTKSHRSCPPC